jgi:hypothetical protein
VVTMIDLVGEQPAPKSRRLRARRGNGGQVIADMPLGWVLVEMGETG